MEEYYLLYYEWKYSERAEEIQEDLIYCVSVGDLDAATAQAIAEKYEINYHVENGKWKHFHGFVHYDWVGEEPDEGFFAPYYEMQPRQSLTESLAVACDVAMRRFVEDEDKDSPLSAGFRNTYQNVRLCAEDAEKNVVVSQPVISTDEALVIRTPFSPSDQDQPSDSFRDYFYARLAGGPRDPFEDFDIILDPKRAWVSADVFLYRLFYSQNTFTLFHYNGEYMQWKGNAYRKIEAEEVERMLYLFLEIALVKNKDGGYEEFPISYKDMKAIEKILKGKRFSQSDKNIPCWIGNSGEPPASITDPSLLIFGKTKILNLATMESLPPSPHWFNLAALDYDYDPKAGCPQWKEFLDDIFDDDKESKATIMEFMGLCLTTITEFQKGLFIRGPKRSGKGTIAYIMESVVGEHNVEPQLMSDFAQDFGIETFVGKTLVAVSDARVETNKLAGTAEKILSIIGEDKIKINRKHKGALGVRLQTKLLFLSNMLLKIPDESGVLPSRFIYVKLSKSFYGRENKNLRKQLRTELPGILNFAIEHFRNLLKRGAFVQPKTGKVLYDRMMGLCSPVSEFVQELELYMHPDFIWEKWSEFCKDAEQSPGKKKDLWKELEAAGYNCDFDVARILAKIRELGGEALASKLRDCSRKFKKSDVLEQKLDEMVELGLLNVRSDTAGNKQPTKFYSIPNET